ncbi:receptor-like serine/threonine-protein kinase SD1-7 [Wolffia australiana]
MSPLLFSLLLSLLSLSPLPLSSASDRLPPGASLSLNQTLLSPNAVFSLGFLPSSSSSSSSSWFAAIFYTHIPSKTPVWVANRDSPLTDPDGTLTLTPDGALSVLDGQRRRLWSSHVSVPDAAAFLLNSGNLVLRRGGAAATWQSFDHPTDTLLPGMKLRLNKTSGEATKLTSNGFIFTLEPRFGLETLLLHGRDLRWRGPMWLGIPILSVQFGDVSSRYIQTVHVSPDEIYYNYTMEDSALLVRYLLGIDGTYSFLVWDGSSKTWNATNVVPARPCDWYNRCGSGSSCDPSGGVPLCRCLDGFSPKDATGWKNGNFSSGCEPRRRLACDGSDGYKKIGGMKLPDGYSVAWDLDMGQCRQSCSLNCACRGFSHVNYSTFNMSGARCLTWGSELKDLVQVPLLSQDLYLRLAAAELADVPIGMAPASSPPGKSGRRVKILLAVGISAGLVLSGVCCYCLICRLGSRKGGDGERADLLPLEEMILASELAREKGSLPMVQFKCVRAATGNFSCLNLLGEGGFGPVYKGKLKNGEEVAVKRLSKASKQGSEEFANEVLLIAKLQHRNLVRLLCWCAHGKERILIYEFMPNKSLDSIIFDPRRSGELTWERRFAIIKGVADGIHYLHLHSRMRVIHRDLKTNNILLDKDMNPKISDFGLARIFDMNQTQANTKRVVGTYGYMAPEYALDGIFSEKSDVYSFGVIVLEIITGKRCTGYYPYKNSLNLLGYAWQLWEEGRGLELLDPAMDSRFSEIEVLKCMQVGLLCVQEFTTDRPTMTSIVSFLCGECGSLQAPKQPAFAIGRDSNPSSSPFSIAVDSLPPQSSHQTEEEKSC